MLGLSPKIFSWETLVNHFPLYTVNKWICQRKTKVLQLHIYSVHKELYLRYTDIVWHQK